MRTTLNTFLEITDLFRLILYFRSKPTKSLHYTSNFERITLEICCTEGVSSRYMTSQGTTWVGFKYQAAGQTEAVPGAWCCSGSRKTSVQGSSSWLLTLLTSEHGQSSVFPVLLGCPALGASHSLRSNTPFCSMHVHWLMCYLLATEGEDVQNQCQGTC